MGANQHFVPKFYFRRFSTRPGAIGVLLRRSGRLIDNAPIRSQASRHWFYKTQEVETLLSQLEAKHAVAMTRWADWAHFEDAPTPTDSDYADLIQAIILQHSRTLREVRKRLAVKEEFALQSFRHYLSRKPDLPRQSEMLAAIDAGQLTMRADEHAAVLQQLSISLQETALIADLAWCMLVNHTDYPFIFSDAPVVFINTYCRNVKNRGVLGLQCPGLQIFYPLDRFTAVMFYDGDRYAGPAAGAAIYPLDKRSDVSQLNAMQVLNAEDAIYFGDPADREYVSDLWAAHRPRSEPTKAQLIHNPNLLIDGAPASGHLMQIMEPQIPCNLSLSFLRCRPISEQDYVFEPRNRELWLESKRRSKANPRH